MSRKHGFKKLDVTFDLYEPFKKDIYLRSFYSLFLYTTVRKFGVRKIFKYFWKNLIDI